MQKDTHRKVQKVAMIDINPQVKIEAERIAASGNQAKAYMLDITDRDAVLQCFVKKELRILYV